MINNKRAAALTLAYMVISVLTTLGMAFVSGSISEANSARRYSESERAFWIAEAGMAQAYRDWAATGATGAGAAYGNGNYVIDSSALPIVVITGTYGSGQSVLQASFVRVPNPFQNSLSVGGDMSLVGILARLEVYDRTRISGNFTKSGIGAQSWFADKLEGVSQTQTTIPIPDYSDNGVTNEFADFVAFGRLAVQSYPPEEVVYIQNNGTVNIFPSSALVGKKVIFVEGSTPGAGDVNIFFDGTWRDDEDLTVISTGTISYVMPLQLQENARLSTVAWDDYNEVAIFRSQHESVTYAHDDATFIDILDWGSSTGNIIVGDDMSLLEVLTYERYYYSDRVVNGDMPPGFSLLSGSVGTPLFMDWREIS